MPSQASADHLLRLGDDSLILGQRLSEWCGRAPTLELDLSLANLGLDLLGQAQHFLGLAAERRGLGEDADRLAFGRDVLDFRNCLLVEQPNGDFGQTIARQFLFSTWQEARFEALAASADPQIAAVARKAVKEVAYHATFACEWVIRLGDGTAESRARLEAGLAWMWRFAAELAAPRADEQVLAQDGVLPDPATLESAWLARLDNVLGRAGLARPRSGRPILGGRDGRHSEHLGHILSEMQFLHRAYPGATW